MNKLPLYIFLISIISASCSKEADIVPLNLDDSIQKFVDRAKKDTSKVVDFPLCAMIGDEKWDQLSVVGGYVSDDALDSLGLKNLSLIKKELDKLYFREAKTAFIFSEQGMITAFTTINTKQVYANFIVESQKGSSLVNQMTFKKEICKNLVLKASKSEVLLTDKRYVKSSIDNLK